jgi:hypothetical protein
MYFDGQFWGGPPCRTVDVRAGAAALTVWIDDEHVRQIRPEYRGRGGARRSPLRVGCLKGRTFAATLEPRIAGMPGRHGRLAMVGKTGVSSGFLNVSR